MSDVYLNYNEYLMKSSKQNSLNTSIASSSENIVNLHGYLIYLTIDFNNKVKCYGRLN